MNKDDMKIHLQWLRMPSDSLFWTSFGFELPFWRMQRIEGESLSLNRFCEWCKVAIKHDMLGTFLGIDGSRGLKNNNTCKRYWSSGIHWEKVKEAKGSVWGWFHLFCWMTNVSFQRHFIVWHCLKCIILCTQSWCCWEKYVFAILKKWLLNCVSGPLTLTMVAFITWRWLEVWNVFTCHRYVFEKSNSCSVHYKLTWVLGTDDFGATEEQFSIVWVV